MIVYSFNLLLLTLLNGILASYVTHPNINFDPLEQLTISGSYNGISLYKDTKQLTSIQPLTSSIISLSNDTLQLLGSSNIDGIIHDACIFKNTLVFGGNFSNFHGQSVKNIASIDLTTHQIIPLSKGLDGQVYSIYCDTDQIYVGGSFVAPSTSDSISYSDSLSQFGGNIALWKNDKWVGLPWKGLNGPVYSILKNKKNQVIFGGRFDTTTDGQSVHAPASQPIRLPATGVSATSGSNPSSILCNSSSWLLDDGVQGTWQTTFETYSVNPSLVRIVNSKVENHQTKEFSIRSLTNSTHFFSLSYLDPITGMAVTCINNCTLSNDPSVTYQDFRILDTFMTTGIAIDIKSWYGVGGGLSFVQVFQSEIFTYAVNSDPNNICTSNATLPKISTVGNWTQPTTTDSPYLSYPVKSTSDTTSISFYPNIAESGIYEVLIYTPSCKSTSCSERTDIDLTFALSTTNKENATMSQKYPGSISIFKGYFDLSQNYNPFIQFSLAKNASLSTTSELVALSVQLVKIPTDDNLSSVLIYNSTQTNITMNSLAWGALPDNVPYKSIVQTMQVNSNDDLYLAGTFTGKDKLNSPYTNIVQYDASVNQLRALAGGGLDGVIQSMVATSTDLYVGGSFNGLVNTTTSSINSLINVAQYNIQNTAWSSLKSGVNGPVKSISVSSNALLVSGEFTQLVKSSTETYPIKASGNAWWDTKKLQWISDTSVPYLSGTIYKALSQDNADYFIGHVKSAQRYQSNGVSFLSSKDTLKSIPFYPGDSQASVNSGVLFNSKTSMNLNSTTILGGEFHLPNNIQNIAIYNNQNNTWSGFEGADWQGQISTMAVNDNLLYVGGRFTSTTSNNLAVFDISNRSLSLFPNVQTSDGSPANVNMIRYIPEEKVMIVGGNFSTIGSLPCVSICSLDTASFQWNTLGSGLMGEVYDFLMIDGKLVTSGNMTLNNSPLTIAEFNFKKNTWGPFDTANLPGPSRTISYDNITNHLYISGQTAENSSTYLRIWDGQQFKSPVVELGSGSLISKLTMLPISDSKTNILLATGFINLGELGNVSAAFYDGEAWIPYLVTSNDNGDSTSTLSSMFFLDQPYVPAIIKKYLPTPIVILVSIAVALGIVFLIVFCAMFVIYLKRKRDSKVNPQSSPSGYYGKPPRTPQSLLTMLKETSANEDQQIDKDDMDHGNNSLDKPRHFGASTEQFYNMSKSISTEHLHEQSLTPFNTAIAMTTARAPPPLPTAHARSISNQSNFHQTYPTTAVAINASAGALATTRPESYARPISEFQRDTDSFYNQGYTHTREMVEVPGRQSPYNPFRNSEGFTNHQSNPITQSVAVGAFHNANNRQIPSTGESISYNNITPNTSTAGISGTAVLAAAGGMTALSHNRNETNKNQSQGTKLDSFNNLPPPTPRHIQDLNHTGKGSPLSLVGASDESSLVDPISGPQATATSTGNVKWTTANSKEALGKVMITSTPTIAVHESDSHLPQENYHDAQSTLSVNNTQDMTGSNVRWTNVDNKMGVATVEPTTGSRESTYHDSFYYPLNLGPSNHSLLNPMNTTSEGLSSDPDIARWTTAPVPNVDTFKVEPVPITERPNSTVGRSQYQPSLTSINAFPPDTHLDHQDYLSHAPKTHIDAEIEDAADDVNTRVMHKNAFRLSEAPSLTPIDTSLFSDDNTQDELLSPDSAVRWKSANVGSPIETVHAVNILTPATAMVTRRSANELENDAFEDYYNPKPQQAHIETLHTPKTKNSMDVEPIGRKSETIDDVIANRDLNALSMLIQDEEEDQVNPLYKMPTPTVTRKESSAAGPGAMDGRASSKRMVEQYFSSRKSKMITEDKKPKYKSDFKSIMAIAIENNTKYPIATEENPHLYYAKFEFSAREHGELGFGNADPIIVVDSSDDIWWMGYKADKSDGSFIQGVFPSNYVEIAVELR